MAAASLLSRSRWLLVEHPAVTEACVVAVPDEKWGERPLASIVVTEGQSVTAAELYEFMSGT